MTRKSAEAARSILILVLAILPLSGLALPAYPRRSFAGAAPATNGELQDVKDIQSLDPDSRIEREMAGGQAHYYRITLVSGQYLRVVVNQLGVNVVVALFGSDGEKLVEANASNETRGQEIVSLIAGSSGDYRLEARPFAKDARAGRYDVKIEDLRMAVAQDASRIAAERAFAEGAKLKAEGTAESKRKAIEKYEESLPLWEAADDQAGKARTLDDIGEIFRQQGEMRKALDYFSRALALFGALPDRRREAKAHFEVGWVSLGLGEMQKALDHYNQALSLYRAVPDRAEEAAMLIAAGVLYLALGESQKALAYYDQALSTWRSINNRSGEAQTLINIGKLYNSLGDKQKALELYFQALPIWREINSRLGEADALTQIGKVYESLGEKQKALDLYLRALEINRLLNNPRVIAFSLNEIGLVYSALGEKQKALDYLEQALSRLRSIGSRRDEANTLADLGQVYLSMSDYHKALESFTQALALLRGLGYRRGEAAILGAIASLERSRGALNESRARIEESLNILETVRAKVTSQELRASYLASVQSNYEFYIDLLMQEHKRRPSEELVATALQASERARARSLLELLIEAQADIRQGVDQSLLERERALQRRLNAKADEQARLLNGRHTEEQAQTIRKEIEAITTEYQQTLAQIRDHSPRYTALTQPRPLGLKEIQSLLEPGDLLLEFALGAERSYLWAVSPASIMSYELPERAEVEAPARRVYELLTARHAARGETDQQRLERVAKADAEYQTAAASLSEMLLGPVTSLPDAKRLVIVADGVLQYMPFGALPVPETERQGGRETGRKEKPRPVARSPRRPVAFAPLIVNHEIVSLPSASVLAALRQEIAGRKPVAGAVAALADPVFDKDDDRVVARAKEPEVAKAKNEASDSGEGSGAGDIQRAMREVEAMDGAGRIPRLTLSRQEAEAIVASAPRGSSLKAVGFKASRATAMSADLGQHRIVHFATHGLLNAEHPELSGVVLSLVDEQGRPQDGFLRLHQIYNLELPVELVVLSACQTGLGKEVKREGLVGLVRGFMYAGAPRVVASLWKVDDFATTKLMGHFYQAMLKNKTRPAEALRRAQIAMWKQKQWHAPYYWAGFVIQGEWK
jgi:tetratricopeptide (TPR) repeat protein